MIPETSSTMVNVTASLAEAIIVIVPEVRVANIRSVWRKENQ